MLFWNYLIGPRLFILVKIIMSTHKFISIFKKSIWKLLCCLCCLSTIQQFGLDIQQKGFESELILVNFVTEMWICLVTEIHSFLESQNSKRIHKTDGIRMSQPRFRTVFKNRFQFYSKNKFGFKLAFNAGFSSELKNILIIVN